VGKMSSLNDMIACCFDDDISLSLGLNLAFLCSVEFKLLQERVLW